MYQLLLNSLIWLEVELFTPVLTKKSPNSVDKLNLLNKPKRNKKQLVALWAPLEVSSVENEQLKSLYSQQIQMSPLLFLFL